MPNRSSDRNLQEVGSYVSASCPLNELCWTRSAPTRMEAVVSVPPRVPLARTLGRWYDTEASRDVGRAEQNRWGVVVAKVELNAAASREVNVLKD
jgi:hypothetical protein